MKILLTGFAPFGGEAINPSYEALKTLPTVIRGADVVCVELPTAFQDSLQALYLQIEKHSPDLILCVGQAGGRFELTLERVAINIDDARIPDNKGEQPIDTLIFADGENAYFTNLPVKAMLAAARQKGIPASLSNSAGTYVCNHVMYGLLHFINTHGLSAYGGFLHVPYLPEQVIHKSNTPFMPLEMITSGILAMLDSAIEIISEKRSDLKSFEGQLH